jgi:hypothetical protein
VLLLLPILAPLASPEPAMLTAEHSTQCGVSHIAIYASGFAHRYVSNTCGTVSPRPASSLRRLKPEDLEELKRALQESGFDALPNAIEPDPHVVGTEEAIFTIAVRQNGHVKQVSGYRLDQAVNKRAAQQFLAIWATVERLAGAP